LLFMHFRDVLQEERQLEEMFGEEYRQYRARAVQHWCMAATPHFQAWGGLSETERGGNGKRLITLKDAQKGGAKDGGSHW